MNFSNLLTQILAETESSGPMEQVSNQILFAAVAIVASGIIGLLIGFFLGTNYGKMSGELKVLKALKTDRSRKSRSRSELEQEAVG